MELSTVLPLLLVLLTGGVIGCLLGVLWARTSTFASPGDDVIASLESRVADQSVIRDGLDRLDARVRDLAHQGVSWQSQLRQQVEDVRHSADLLRRETGTLATALRKPQVRGRWGELHLRRSVELAGLVDRCDFSEQSRLHGDEGSQVPDLVVHLAGGRSIVVDAKVPLDAFLDATGTDDPEEHAAHLKRHARQLHHHVETLAAKAYWRTLPESPDFVVLFVPGDSFLSAALEAEPDLIERAAEKQVILATPTTLIALLRTVAMGWSHAVLAERTREIHQLGRDLHERLGVMGGHLDRLGRSLKSSVDAYNRTVGSLEARVLVSARQFTQLGVSHSPLDAPEAVDEGPRPLTAIELLESVAPVREELPGLFDPPVSAPTAGAAAERAAGE